ncbi:hypothetical protein T02_6754 [Trichinella nativa]|uniref:Uncharacterized protein n=1 Tax=Trichinella nativa TaxID=6335 RepID=A0A0V1L8Y3_9BILA|nr:hypothetical protein T02_6754 [Trichinella nativa]
MTACDELYLRISSLSFRATDIRRLNRRKCILFCIEAARLAHERRTSLLQYNTDAEVRGVMRAMRIQETDDYDGLKSALFEPFRMRTGLEQGENICVYAGHLRWLFLKAFSGIRLSADAIKAVILRSGTDSFMESIEFAVQEERVSSEMKSCSPCMIVSTQANWGNGGHWHESESDYTGLE